MRSISTRVLSLLQLTRMALVFTAIADSLCTLLLWTRKTAGPGADVFDFLDVRRVTAVVVISAALYGFGMSLNDIIDRRRDTQLAAHRPLPSGRIGIVTAHLICVMLALAALLAGAFYARWTRDGELSLLLIAWTGMLITFYDFAGKYLVAPGLLTLGLIRFFHAVVPAPELPLLWHPLLLLNHVTILSAVAYHWEQKRPPLTKLHWWAVLSGLAFVNVASVALVWWRRGWREEAFASGLWVEPGLVLPAVAVGLFIVLAVLVKRRAATQRQAGQTLMLYGLLWLIVYDAAFAAAYVGLLPAALLLALLPLAYLSVQLMRWWSQLVSLSKPPQFKRAQS